MKPILFGYSATPYLPALTGPVSDSSVPCDFKYLNYGSSCCSRAVCALHACMNTENGSLIRIFQPLTVDSYLAFESQEWKARGLFPCVQMCHMSWLFEIWSFFFCSFHLYLDSFPVRSVRCFEICILTWPGRPRYN